MENGFLLPLVVGLLTGGLIGFLAAKLLGKGVGSDHIKLQSELDMELEKSSRFSADLQLINNQLKEEREKMMSLSGENATLKADLKNLLIRMDEQKGQLAELQEKFALQFKNLANEIFEEKSKKFTEQNKVNLDSLLKPLGEKLISFEQKVESSNKENMQWNTFLKVELGNLKDLNQKITKEAESLTKALKGESKTQGNWGEMQLESILDKVGLQKDVHYFKEKNFKTEDGSNQRLDYIIKMPDNKYLVLDSKVSLTAYSNYFDHEGKEEQAIHLKKHLESINSHIKLLGEKNYQNLYDIEQPDFVLMFVANEPALTIALKEDHELYEKALDKNIVLVSTSTLLATMRTVSYIWKQDLQNKNAVEIARQAGALYDKFEGFTTDLLKLGNSLKQSKDTYDQAMNKLSQGSGNLVRRSEKLRELGAKASKQIDQRLVDRSTD